MSDPFDLDTLSDPSAVPEQASAATSAPPPPNTHATYLEGLNPPQREAIEQLDGPVLVLAGAGTGKTRVLTSRLVHLLATGNAWPGQILAVTFTNKAAREMRERVEQMVGDHIDGMPWLGTFHAIAARILRRHAAILGLDSNFTILDTDDQVRLLKQIIEAEGLDEKRWPAKLLAAQIDSWKNRALTPDKVPEGEAAAFANGLGRRLYQAYQDRLKVVNATDFGDLLLHCLTLFLKHKDILEDYQRRFRYILVDEYQDTNVAQYLWLRLLAQQSRNICCVGDDDQSIYGWRGAEVGNILRFEEDFPDAKVIRLEQNYRSTSHILGAASGLIAANQSRLGKTLWTAADGGEKVTIKGVWDGREEARQIGEEIEQLQRKQKRLSDIAILVRAGFQTREFEERFFTLGLPYRIIGGLRFYERQEIRDAIAYLRVIAQPNDSLAFERILNVPKRGLGPATLQRLHQLSRAQAISLPTAAGQLIETDELRPQARKKLQKLLDDFDRWRALQITTDHMDLTDTVLEESGYTDMWQADKSPEAPGRLDNLSELVRGMEQFADLGEFLEHISLVMDNEANDSQDKVTIMTLHGAKGLEFDTVFLPGWEEELFPHQRSLDEAGQRGLEEERRLAYVGITRARKNAHIYYAAQRYMYGQYKSCIPSRFINELPADHIEHQGQAGMFAGDTNQNPLSSSAWANEGIHEYQMNRRRAAFSQSATNIEAQKRKIREASEARHQDSGYAIGTRVFHDKFGYGVITALDGNKLEIDFEHGSTRKLMESFVKPA
ncbi:MAG: DNA helicase II [Kordiimonas sp.]|nr:DNA helicase II [Kordiimonas sp.]|tara:strand:- start:649 stop:2982 length:2334 start_codon:yes stop_codon:yes gene_type:complete